MLVLLFLLSPWLAPSAFGAFSLGVDATFSGLYPTETSLKTHTYVMVGTPSFSLGPVLFFDYPHPYSVEMIAGLGTKMGESFFIEVDGGALVRRYHGTIGRGFSVALIPGYAVNRYFRISIPIIYKRILGGLTARQAVEYLPYLGVGFAL